MPLWRLQVRITTGTLAGGGPADPASTNAVPAIRFNNTTSGTRVLNPPAVTAFDAGHVDSYDLRLLGTPSEITMLRLGIAARYPGSAADPWCIKKIELLFNGRVAFAADAVPGGGACATITGGTYLQYSATALRSNAAWAAYGTPPSLPTKLSAVDLRTSATDVTGSAMRSTPGYEWDPSSPLTVTQKTTTSVRISFGILEFDPNGIDPVNNAKVAYDIQLFVGSDGRLHAMRTSASNWHDQMSGAVITQLDTALSRMTARPAPHDPLRFGVDVFTNTAWTYTPVFGR